ncbi:hypothetical protein PoB_004708800 [Plakobranchus ocellatus]|uniref:Uncharacterized protein n=1 Tax=Plakobranchus ocellatus TaxID=259542 RepID=A0AAV4BN71_9GAST|nr:hypothetical protein PoB_004708800 [Plakobranchus ocellatus]
MGQIATVWITGHSTILQCLMRSPCPEFVFSKKLVQSATTLAKLPGQGLLADILDQEIQANHSYCHRKGPDAVNYSSFHSAVHSCNLFTIDMESSPWPS